MSLFEEIDFDFEEDQMFNKNDFLNDSRKEKINCSIGMIWNEDETLRSHPKMFDLENELLSKNLDKEYSTLTGISSINENIKKLFFGEDCDDKRFFVSQMSSGGAALRIGSILLRKFLNSEIYVSNLTFNLYYNLFEDLEIKTYPYFDSKNKRLDFENLMNFLENIKENSILNFQLSNHNPTGLDFNKDQWDNLAKVISKKNHFVFFDCAYLGLSKNIEDEIYPLKLFYQSKIEFFLAFSSAKMTYNYSEDIGYLLGWTKCETTTKDLIDNIKILNRAHFSFTSLHGARIINEIINQKLYIEETKFMRNRISILRNDIINKLKKKNFNNSLLDFYASQTGIYLFLDLSNNQVNELKIKYGIYVLLGGRVNITSINNKNIDYFVDSINSSLNNV